MSYRAGIHTQHTIERAARAAAMSLRPGEVGRAIEAAKRGDTIKAARILNRAKGLSTPVVTRSRAMPEASR